MTDAFIRLLVLIEPGVKSLLDRHLSEYDELLATVFLAELATHAFETEDLRLLHAISDLLLIAGPHVSNLLLTGFVEGVPPKAPDRLVRLLTEPLRSAVADDLGRTL